MTAQAAGEKKVAGGNSIENATSISMGTSYVTTLEDWGIVYYFKFKTLAQDAYYYLESQNINVPGNETSDQLFVEIISEYEEILVKNGHTKSTKAWSGNYKLEPNTTYYVRICSHRRSEDFPGNLKFKVLYKIDQDENIRNKATNITLNSTYKRTIDGHGDEDWFSFQTGSSKKYELYGKNVGISTHTWSSDCYFRLTVLNAYSEELQRVAVRRDEDGRSYVVLEPNTKYYIVAKNYWEPRNIDMQNDEGNYLVSIREAKIKSGDVTVKGTTKVYDGTAQKPEVQVVCYGKTLVENEDYTLTYSNNKNPGKAKVVIKGIGNYEGTVTKYFKIVPKAPTTLNVTLTGHDDIKVSWSKATGASGYYVYYRTESASKFSSKVVTGTSTTFSNMADSTKYIVKIVPYVLIDGAKVSSTVYSAKSIKTLANLSAPSKLTLTLTGHDDIKASWSKVSKASGYYVYYKTASATKYSSKVVTGTSTTLSNLADSTKYTIKIVPYGVSGTTKVKSDNYIAKSITTLKNLAAPSKLTLTLTGHNDIKASWNKVTGAKGYYVYYKTASATKFSLKIVTGTSTTFSNRAALTKYIIKVVPYGVSGTTKIKSDNYIAKSITTLKNLAAPSKLTLKLTGHDDIKASWSKVTGAKGYYVFYKTAKATKYTSKVVTGTSIALKDMADSTKYTIKVVPYGISGTTKVQSDNYKTGTITTRAK